MTTNSNGFPQDLDREKVAAWVHGLWALSGPAMPEDYTVADAVIGAILNRGAPPASSFDNDGGADWERWMHERGHVARGEAVALNAAPETGAPPTHEEWMARLVVAESYSDDARDEERRS